MTARPSSRRGDRVGRREDDGALGRAGGGGDTAGHDLVLRRGIEGGVQQRVQRARLDRGDRLLARQQALADRVDGEAHGGLRGALRVARLQHVQAPLLDGELGVLHVAVVALEGAHDVEQLGVRLGHPVAQLGQVARGAHARDHVLALGVDEEVAAGLGRAGHLVAREGHARARGRALVAVDHLLDVDRRAPVVRDVVDAPVGDGALAHPRVEDRADGLLELLARIGGEVVERLEARRQLAQRVGVELRVERDAALALDARDLVLEARAGDAAHDAAEHLHEPAIGVPREARIAGALRQALDGLVVEAQVQDGVHHPRHRVARAAAHGDEQRVVRIAERLAGALLQARERRVDGRGQPLRLRAVGAHVLDAGLRRDRETRRDEVGPEHARHLGDAGALASQQFAHVARALGEVVDPLGGDGGAHRMASGCMVIGRVGHSAAPASISCGRDGRSWLACARRGTT